MRTKKQQLGITKMCQSLSIRASRPVLAATPGLLALILHLINAVPARAELYPLPPWYFYGMGNGSTWGGSSTSPDNAQLTVSLFPPTVPNQYATAVATGSQTLLQLAPATTYTVTLSAMVSGSGSAHILMLDDSVVISNTSISGSTWKRYTNSFTTGGSEDQRVGRNLHVQLLLNRFGGLGTTTANFTNVQFHVLAFRPALAYSLPGQAVFQLSWPTNFQGYVLQQTTSLETSSWEAVTNLPVAAGDQFMIQVDRRTGQRFFRLKQP
ncbi:MAG TPA: hypothetical protein VN673_12780 [Clostridia bacterium]|nr:hypothetical protein [Clostridia bacterium]